MHNFTSAFEATSWCRANAAWNCASVWVNGSRYFYGPMRIGMYPGAIVVPIASVADSVMWLPRTRDGVETFD